MQPIRLVAILSVVFAVALSAVASKVTHHRSGHIQEIVEKARRLQHQYPDSALWWCAVATAEYSEDKSKEVQSVILEAYLTQWRIYFYEYFDFPSAYQCLLEAQEIMEASSIPSPKINLAKGILFQTLGEDTHNQAFGDSALNCYRMAFRQAIADPLHPDIHIITPNLFNQAYLTGHFGTVRTEYDMYKCLKDTSERIKYNIASYNALQLMNSGQYCGAALAFDSLASVLPSNDRDRLISIVYKAAALEAENHFSEASHLLDKAIVEAARQGARDVLMELYPILARVQNKEGRTYQAMQTAIKGYMLKDSLVGYRQGALLNEIRFGREIDRVNNRLAYLSEKRHLEHVAATVGGIILIILALAVGIVLNRNKRLREANEALYAKNLKLLENAQPSMATEAVGECNRTKQKTGGKYAGSALDEEEAARLMSRIEKVMAESNEYLSPDFNLEKLAKMCDSKYKQVSQVINEKCGCNFNSFVNSYRIREACLRICDRKKWGGITLDALGQSVGFRAKSSFIKAFKTETGLTPSQFQKFSESSQVIHNSLE